MNKFYTVIHLNLKIFLNSTYDNYVRDKDSSGFKAIFRHYIMMKESNHSELNTFI